MSSFQQTLVDVNARFQGPNAWQGLKAFAADLSANLSHGDMAKWQAALEALAAGGLDQQETTRQLMQLHPWRKGPLNLFGCQIDTEWRSDWKWQRLLSSGLDLNDKHVLDVGCGNGFYMYEMLKAGAKSVVGVDPTLLFVAQFLAMQLDEPTDKLAFVPTGLEKCPETHEGFDVVMSMGVLYHRKDQLEHLTDLQQRCKVGGQLVLETMILEGAILEGEGQDELVPHMVGNKRYAQMRNVWSIPTVPLLMQRMRDCGYSNIQLVDCAYTSLDEQRPTDWMTFQSLGDFLDPVDRSKTVEGHQAPKRALLIAERLS